MPNRAIPYLKAVVHALCLLPALMLLRMYFNGTLALEADPVNYITHFTGNWALWMLLGSLAITPLRRLWAGLSWMMKIWPTMLDDLKKRKFIQVGLAAWTILLVLAVTSPQRVLRAMGGKNWARVHRLVYLAGALACVHYWWLVKTGVRTPWKVTAVLAVLLLVRVGFAVGKRLKTRSVVAA